MSSMATTELIFTQRNLNTLSADVISAFGECIEHLDLSHNRIADLSWIYEFKNLKCLILDCNRLRECHFQRLQKPLGHLKVLMLNKNEMSDLEASVSILSQLFPNLVYLSLHGNPICPDELELQPFCQNTSYEYDYYRTQILNRFKKLRFLDHIDMQSEFWNRVPRENAENAPRTLTFTPRVLWTKLSGASPADLCESSSIARYHKGAAGTSNREDCICNIDSSAEGNRFISDQHL